MLYLALSHSKRVKIVEQIRKVVKDGKMMVSKTRMLATTKILTNSELLLHTRKVEQSYIGGRITRCASASTVFLWLKFDIKLVQVFSLIKCSFVGSLLRLH
jgi:hypothetical protein